MAANRIHTWLARADTPTPAVSYAVVNKQATAGMMITASHNAPRYNGVKLKANYGGSASSNQNRRVEYYLERNLETATGPNLMNFDDAVAQDLIVKFDPSWAYYEHLSTLVDLDCISSAELRVVADGMYGAGRGVFGEMLARGRTGVHNIRHEMNPGFGGIHPEPITRNLGILMSTIQAGHWDVGLATDGDADRIGAVDDRGDFVDPHRIFTLVLRYLIEKRKLTGRVVRTVSTTRMIDRIANHHDLPVYETPVGFNYIADYMLKEEILIGGEESGGIAFQGHIPEGDGSLMALLLIEMVSKLGVSLSELVQDLVSTYGPVHYQRTDLRLSQPISKTQMTRQLTEEKPPQIGGDAVVEVQSVDGVKYILEDDSWLLIRPSGTEPVLRVYAEGRSPETVQNLLDFGEKVAAGTT